MKNAEEILKELYCCEPTDEKQDLQLQITLNPDLDRILQAMHEYASQSRWVKVDKDNLPTCEVLAINACGCYAIGILGIGTHGDVICYNKQLTMYDVTHYQIPTPPKD